MKTAVITDGMGRVLATACLRRSNRVVVIDTDSAERQAILEATTGLDAADRVEFLRADLSMVAENRRLIDRITAAYPVVDQLVLAARYFRATRQVTADGFEANFALFYLSRYMFGHGLTANLERAGEPVIPNLAGPSGALSEIQWDD